MHVIGCYFVYLANMSARSQEGNIFIEINAGTKERDYVEAVKA